MPGWRFGVEDFLFWSVIEPLGSFAESGEESGCRLRRSFGSLRMTSNSKPCGSTRSYPWRTRISTRAPSSWRRWGLSVSRCIRRADAGLLSLPGLSPVIHSFTPNMWITLWEKDGQACLFQINLFTSPGEVDSTMNYLGKPVKITQTVRPITVKVVDL
jgi:hypothetical protein